MSFLKAKPTLLTLDQPWIKTTSTTKLPGESRNSRQLTIASIRLELKITLNNMTQAMTSLCLESEIQLEVVSSQWRRKWTSLMPLMKSMKTVQTTHPELAPTRIAQTLTLRLNFLHLVNPHPYLNTLKMLTISQKTRSSNLKKRSEEVSDLISIYNIMVLRIILYSLI